MNEMQLNQQVAEQICDVRQANGRQFQLGTYVALLDGQVVAVAGDPRRRPAGLCANWTQTPGAAWSSRWRHRLPISFAENEHGHRLLPEPRPRRRG